MSIFGNILTNDEVEQAVLDTIKEWDSTYLAEIERQKGYSAGDLPRPKSYVVASEFDGLPGDEQLPMVIVIAPGLQDPPAKDGRQRHRAEWQIAVVVLVSVRRNPTNTPRKIAGLYGAAVRSLLVQRRSLEGRASGTRWIDETYQDVSTEDSRSLGACRVVFGVEFDDVVTGDSGPNSPAPQLDPLAPYPDPPTVEETTITGSAL